MVSWLKGVDELNPFAGGAGKPMNIFEANRAIFHRAFDFTGRSGRSEFWWGVVSPLALAYLLPGVLTAAGMPGDFAFKLLAAVMVIYGIPLLAVAFRRLQDTNIDGPWLILMIASSVVGGLVMGVVWLVFFGLFCVASTDMPNKYGPPPPGTPKPSGPPKPSGTVDPVHQPHSVPAAATTGAAQEPTPAELPVDGAAERQANSPAGTALPAAGRLYSPAYFFRMAAVFDGRAPRYEFVSFLLLAIWGYAATLLLEITWLKAPPLSSGLFWAYHLMIFLAGLSLQVRRLHDLDLGGFWVLGGFVPPLMALTPVPGGWFDADFWSTAVGFVYLVCFALLRGSRGANRFGADPLDAAAQAVRDTGEAVDPPENRNGN